jgi:hypothetical protein
VPDDARDDALDDDDDDVWGGERGWGIPRLDE